MRAQFKSATGEVRSWPLRCIPRGSYQAGCFFLVILALFPRFVSFAHAYVLLRFEPYPVSICKALLYYGAPRAVILAVSRMV